MNIRHQAITEGKLTYNSGKPCRRGHVCDRYTSNGCCIECLNFHTGDKRAEFAIAKGKRNIAKSSSFRDHTVMVRQGHRVVLEELADILQYGDEDKISKIIHAEYLLSPTPRAITREDLAFIDFRNGRVYNTNAIEFSHPVADEPVCVIINGQFYNAEHCIEVLQGTRLNVKPTKEIPA